MIFRRGLTLATFGFALLLGTAAVTSPARAETLAAETYIGDPATGFADPGAAVAAFKQALSSNDLPGMAKLLGLDAERLKNADGIMDRFAEIRQGAAERITIEEAGDSRVISIGNDVWPFPFPLHQADGGQWAFDTYAGIEEIVNRRVGENELQAIGTARAYVEAQRDYASGDLDGDGVPEFAQKLVSSEGKTDGLYWPIEQGDGDSPAGASVSAAELRKAQSANSGYFGYRFRILRGQGNQVAGGRYDYVVNGNMIAGFALIAWPVDYARTGVSTFMVNHAGIVYEKDLGSDTETIAMGTFRFNPDTSWTISGE